MQVYYMHIFLLLRFIHFQDSALLPSGSGTEVKINTNQPTKPNPNKQKPEKTLSFDPIHMTGHLSMSKLKCTAGWMLPSFKKSNIHFNNTILNIYNKYFGPPLKTGKKNSQMFLRIPAGLWWGTTQGEPDACTGTAAVRERPSHQWPWGLRGTIHSLARLTEPGTAKQQGAGLGRAFRQPCHIEQNYRIIE